MGRWDYRWFSRYRWMAINTLCIKMKEQKLEAWVREELKTLMPNMIWYNDSGEYELFGRYRLIKERTGYRVFCSATDVGVFSGTKSAVSWCIADKYRDYNLARHILHTDTRLEAVNNDIYARVGAANRSKRVEFKENIDKIGRAHV